MGRRAWAWAMLLVSVVPIGCGSGGGAERPELSLAVAASLTDAMQEVGEAFVAGRQVDLTYNFAASGALAQQLLAAPRSDLFLSANERWMDEVEDAGRIIPETRRNLLSNRLVAIGHPGSRLEIGSPTDLCDSPFAYLSIGDPDSVPAGRYARRWLSTVPCPDGGDVWNAVHERIAPAPDVRAALNQVIGGSDIVGIVYRTDYTARRDEIRLLFDAADAGPTIRYPVAILESTGVRELAREFLDFLSGPEAREIFEAHGFLTDPGGDRGGRGMA